jgi:hypothetical protein
MMLKSILLAVAMVMQFGCVEDFTVAAGSNALLNSLEGCLDAYYEGCFYETPATIPDAYLPGITLGPLLTSYEVSAIQGVLLGIEISHPHTADVGVTLHYDSDNDGVYDASSPVEIYLARLDPCDGEEFWACPVELHGAYYFSDEGWASFGETASFDVFLGLQSGGSFYLTIVDSLEGDVGLVESWGVLVEKGVYVAQE